MKKKILLIDDDATYLYILKRLLKKHDTVGKIVTAKSGSEALDILKIDFKMCEMPLVIISDIDMPDMNGISFLKELESLNLVDYTITKIVLNSSNSQYDDLDWSITKHTIAYFQKPLLHEHLLTILSD